MIKISVDQNKISIYSPNLLNVIVVKRLYFRAQKIIARVSGDVNGESGRQIRILPPQLGVILTPGE